MSAVVNQQWQLLPGADRLTARSFRSCAADKPAVSGQLFGHLAVLPLRLEHYDV